MKNLFKISLNILLAFFASLNLVFAQFNVESFKPYVNAAPGLRVAAGFYEKYLLAPDLNGDGLKDVYVDFGQVYPSSFNAYLNTTNTSTGVVNFDVPNNYYFEHPFDPDGFTPYVINVTVGDLNNDKKDDIIILGRNYSQGGLYTYLSQCGSKSIDFSPPRIDTVGLQISGGPTFWSGTWDGAVITHDLDNNGWNDIIAFRRANKEGSSAADETITVLYNTSPANVGTNQKNLKFEKWSTTQTTASYPNFISKADFNNDGKMDFVVAYSFGVGMGVYINTSTYTGVGTSNGTNFAPVQNVAVPFSRFNGGSKYKFTLEDFDNDGKVDIALSPYTQDANGKTNIDSIFVYRNTTTSLSSTISFSLPKAFAINRPRNVVPESNGSFLSLKANPRILSSGDIDADGKADLALSFFDSPYVAVWKNISSVGAINFSSTFQFFVGDGKSSFNCVIGNFTNKGLGKNDIMSLDFTQFQRTRISLLENYINPNGPVISSFSPSSVRVGDLVTITGLNPTFVSNAVVSFTKFDGGKIAVPNSDMNLINSTTIIVRVPYTSVSGPIYVSTPSPGDLRQSLLSITLNADRPIITDFNPKSGPMGTSITFTGSNLDLASLVHYTGLPFIVAPISSTTRLIDNVPSGATSGPIRIGTANGGISIWTSAQFTVTSNIIDFNPKSGGVGSVITIVGYDFNQFNLAGFSPDALGGPKRLQMSLISSNPITKKFTATVNVSDGITTGPIYLIGTNEGYSQPSLDTFTFTGVAASLKDSDSFSKISFYN